MPATPCARKSVIWVTALAATVSLSAQSHTLTPAQQLEALSDRFVADSLDYDPTQAYTTGLATAIHDRFADRTPAAPKSVVRKVLRQLDDLTAGAPEASPFYTPATHSEDPTFKADFKHLISARVNPALRRYRDFLADTYPARPGCRHRARARL